MGSLEILREEFYEQLPAQARRFIDMGLRNGSQLASLINSVLDLERIETGVHGFEFAATRASDLLARALEATRPIAMRLSVALHSRAGARTRCSSGPTRCARSRSSPT